MVDNASFYWNELHAADVAEAKKFYEKVLGWTFEEMPHGVQQDQIYTIAKANGKPVAGIMVHPMQSEEEEEEEGEGAPSQWVAYVHVDDVDAAVAKAEKAGGEVIM